MFEKEFIDYIIFKILNQMCILMLFNIQQQYNNCSDFSL